MALNIDDLCVTLNTKLYWCHTRCSAVILGYFRVPQEKGLEAISEFFDNPSLKKRDILISPYEKAV